MALEQDSARSPDRPSWLTSGLVARLQSGATRLRFLLAVPALLLIAAFTDRPPMWPGVLVALAGETVQIWASAHLHKNVRVVTSGPYAWARNPMYLGRFLVGLGLTLLTWRWFFILPYLVGFWVYAQARVLGEEARLRVLFADEYNAYCRQVRRWLPRPPKERLSDEGWSWTSVRRNHQLRVTAALLLGLALLKWRLEALGPLRWGL
jgi:hypothetical protein